MQETANKQKQMADEMDINLEVFNLETDFFGELHCSSRFTDMLCDASAQYGDYSELEKCPMWIMWQKADESMNCIWESRKLYVIGNGFDLHHGLPCGYADFRAWLQRNRPKVYSTLNRIYGDCDGNN